MSNRIEQVREQERKFKTTIQMLHLLSATVWSADLDHEEQWHFEDFEMWLFMRILKKRTAVNSETNKRSPPGSYIQ